MTHKPMIPAACDSAAGSGLPEIFWDLRTVTQKTGLSRATIYRYMAQGLFPRHRKIGPGRVAWLASEVTAWSFSRPIISR